MHMQKDAVANFKQSKSKPTPYDFKLVVSQA